MYDKTGFIEYFSNVGGASSNTCATYRSFLNRIDDAVGGLDKALDEKGAEALAEWSKHTDAEPFATYRSHARSVLKRYSMYRLQKITDEDDTDIDQEPVVASEILPMLGTIEVDSNFLREKEMQAQVRMQLEGLEEGLVAIDNGTEVTVATGRIDILAKDGHGTTVVIELKPGKCPPGALEQLLAYTYDIEQDTGQPARAMLVAGSFSDRTRAAARRAGSVDLRVYSYSLAFADDG